MARTARDEQEKIFGDHLRKLLVYGREYDGRSVSEVANAIGASRHGLYAVERGKVLSPGFRTVHLLAREYGMDLTELARNAEGGAQ